MQRMIGYTTVLIMVGLMSLGTHPVKGATTVVINEFVSSNGSTLSDEDGDQPDWIEIYNPGSDTLSLDGWYLSDDENLPMMWAFPDVTLEPGGFLVVYASGKDRTEGDHLHTNFSIRSSGEPLLLSDASGVLIDFVEPVDLPRDVSYGRYPDGAANWLYFSDPTPEGPNITTGYHKLLAPPEFSKPGGFYQSSFDLELSVEEDDIEILYTLDGSEPNPDNLDGITYRYKMTYPRDPGMEPGEFFEASIRTHLYSGAPILIEDRTSIPNHLSMIPTNYHPTGNNYRPTENVFKGTVVRAISFRDGSLPSRVITHSYFVDDMGRDRYTLPVISLAIDPIHIVDYNDGLHVPGVDFDNWRLSNPTTAVNPFVPANYQRRGREWEVRSNFEYFANDDSAAINMLLGTRIHGNVTRINPLKSIRLFARNSYDEQNSLDYPFFPELFNSVTGDLVESHKRLILRNSGADYDGTMTRDALVQRILGPIGVDYQDYEPAIVFISGEFWGILNMRERISKEYFTARHSIEPDDVARLEFEAVIVDGPTSMREHYRSMRSMIINGDMSNQITTPAIN